MPTAERMARERAAAAASAPVPADAARPLDPGERATLNSLLARDSAGQAPGVRAGQPYTALINLSVPRRGDSTRQADLVRAGETVYLTADEAAMFNRHGDPDGRQVDVVVPASGPGSRAELPRVPPRAVSGRVWQPPQPPPGSPDARPDPPGSSTVQYATAAIPEAAEPQLGSENSPAVQDAMDIAPAARR